MTRSEKNASYETVVSYSFFPLRFFSVFNKLLFSCICTTKLINLHYPTTYLHITLLIRQMTSSSFLLISGLRYPGGRQRDLTGLACPDTVCVTISNLPSIGTVVKNPLLRFSYYLFPTRSQSLTIN